ncbi:MAG: hypothetical protein HOE90_02405 [Bacteriovoracaceae bacterium]|jgi:hypothetical protein|nr:hypothetical protein [Bacteriovoracaceae bacterium]
MKIAKKVLAVSTILALTTPLFAQEAAEGVRITDIMVQTQSRYRYQESNGTNKLEQNVVLKGTIDFNGLFTLTGVVRTGGTYNGGYNGVIMPDAAEVFDPSGEMHITQLYISKTFGEKVTAQAGALAVDNGISSAATGLSGIGWIDGARVAVKTPYGRIALVGGSLTDPGNSDAYSRERKLNYVELHMTTETFAKVLKAQGGVEYHEDDLFAKAGLQANLQEATGLAISAFAEVVVRTTGDAGVLVSAGGAADLLAIFSDNKYTGVKISAKYIYASDAVKASDRYSGAYTSGLNACSGNHCGVFGLAVTIPKTDGRVTAFGNIRVDSAGMEFNRYEAGVKVKIGRK